MNTTKLFAEFAETFAVGELPPFEMLSAARAELASRKIPAMLDYVATCEAQNVPLVVFSAHRAPINALASRDGWATITGDTPPEERQATVERFQRGELRGVALTIQAGGIGLTLTHASTMLFVDLHWTPALNLQAEDRICRIGQRAGSIQIDVIVANDPLDKRVTEILQEKMALIEASIDATVNYDAATAEQRELARAAAAKRAEIEWSQRRIEQSIETRGVVRSGVSADRRAYLERALAYLAERCDGAVEKDGQGFSQADTHAGRWLAVVGLQDDNVAILADAIVSRYKRQLEALDTIA